VIVPPRAVAVEFDPSETVIEELTSSALATPPSLIVMSPEELEKLAVLNVAMPLFESDASSPEMVLVEMSIPSPAVRN